MSTHTDFTTLGRLGTAGSTPPAGGLRGRARAASSSMSAMSPMSASVTSPGGLQQAGRGGLTVPSRGGRPASHLPKPSLKGVMIAAVSILVGLFVLGTTAQSQLGSPFPASSVRPIMDPALELTLATGGTQMAATGARTLIPGGGSTIGLVEVPKAFAAVDDLALILPSLDVTNVVFGESDVIDMLPLAPVGTMQANDNPEAFEPPRPLDGPQYRVGTPDTGVRPATGMARLYMAPGSRVLSPVTGTVVAVDQITINNTIEWRVVIQPSIRSDLNVVVRRLSVPLVAVGQHVGVGQDALGQSGVSLVDASDHNPEGYSPVLIGVRPGVQADAIDVNQPAVEASAPAD